MMQRHSIFYLLLSSTPFVTGFLPNNNNNNGVVSHLGVPSALLMSSPSDEVKVDPNVYNVPIEKGAEMWTATVNAEPRNGRDVGVPYLDTKSRNHFVDDVKVIVFRDGGMGMNLMELAGGREDGYGITIVESVSGNAEKAGIIPGDSISSVQARSSVVKKKAASIETQEQAFDCECRDFDETIGLLTSFDPEIDSLILNLKRLRRQPKLKVVVEYPPSQCAEGVDNKETIELFAGENLRRALMNRGIVFEDRDARKCDYCGQKCMVKIDVGSTLCNPMSITEEKFMKNNPKCRLSCKTVVGYGMQEGNIRLRVNLNEWKPNEGASTSPFAS